MKIDKVVVNGIEQILQKTDASTGSLLTPKQSFLITPTTRGETVGHEITFEEEDIIELVFEDGTTWLSSPETLDDIFPDARNASNRSGETIFVIPGEISAETAERGIFKKVILTAFNILSKKNKIFDIEKLAAKFEEKQLDGKTGLFVLDKDFQLLDFNLTETDKPYCLLIHGTASSIAGSFDKAKNTPLMDFLVETYGARLLAFQHRTLTENPLQNVLDLVKVLPDKSRLHLITTSRGGLVGEVLSRFCNDENARGFTDEEIAILKKDYPAGYFASLVQSMKEIRDELGRKKITVERFIRIACPAGGTILASKRLDHFFNITINLIGLGAGIIASPVYIALRNLIAAAVDTKNNVYALPGLEAQNPNSPFIRAINGFTGADDQTRTMQINNSLVVIAGNSKAGFQLNALRIIASKLFFLRKNDLVVDTDSMVLGTRRSGRIQVYLYEDSEIDHFQYFKNEKTNEAILRALKLTWGGLIQGFTEVNLNYSYNRDFDLALAGIENTPLGRFTATTRSEINEKPLKVSISQGDLFYSEYPVIVGHFEDDGILYAEISINEYLKGALSQKHQLGIYPGPIGSSEVHFSDPPGFKGAIIVGLGKPENFTASQLTNTVEQGTANYLLHVRKRNLAGKNIEAMQKKGVSSLIVGCGYAGLSIENSIRAIIQGVFNANIKVRNLKLENTLLIEHLEFVELYEDKAVSSLFSISKIEKEETNAFRIKKEGKGIKSLLGYRFRIPSDATEGWWNRITVSKVKNKDKVITCLKFRTSTNSAREEEQELYTTPALLEAILNDFSTSNEWTPERAKTIFELLIPNDFKEKLKRHGNIIWILDHYTASYPWELLQDGMTDTKPVCVSAGMIRQLSTSYYRKNIKTVPKNNALVVADPDLKGFAIQLPGAYKEGQLVSAQLKNHGMNTTPSLNDNHSVIIQKLFCDEYKIIHLSGHGVYNKDVSKGSGMVIGKNMFLSTREIQQMSTVPELVFVNCCHLGNTQGEAQEFYQQRFKLAANIGTQLIENGVRCVIAAGWAVNDDAALEFARVFYDRMFDGYTFGEATKEARKVIFDKFRRSNTWGAYQCYGDPFYKFEHISRAGKSGTKSYMIEQEAEIDLVNLWRELDVEDIQSSEFLEKLREISNAVDDAKLRNPKITELEALIYFELKEYEQACDKFEALLKLEDASFSFSVLEKYCNARAKNIIAEFRLNQDQLKLPQYQERIIKVIEEMNILIRLKPTSNRYNILGSTYKRRAFISKENEKREAYIMAAAMYHKGYTQSQTWYPLTNWLTLESLLIRAELHQWETEITDEQNLIKYKIPSFEEAQEILKKNKASLPGTTEKMNYWDLIAGINISLCEYILTFKEKGSQKDAKAILNDICTLWQIAGSKGKRFAEIEHLEFIIDALTLARNTEMEQLKKNLELLKDELEKMV